jgi:hypothetical protein
MHRRSLQRATLALLVLVTAGLMGGCGRVEASVRTQEALHSAGLPGSVISVQERGGETSVQVRYNSRAPDQEALQAEQDTAARVVWANATVPLDVVRVTPDDNRALGAAAETRVYSRADLTSRFGPRPQGLDSPPALGGPRATVYGFVVLAIALVFIALAALVGVVVVRSRLRRRRALAAATAWPAPGPVPQDGRRGAAPGSPRPPSTPPPPRRGAEPPPGSWPAPPDA